MLFCPGKWSKNALVLPPRESRAGMTGPVSLSSDVYVAPLEGWKADEWKTFQISPFMLRLMNGVRVLQNGKKQSWQAAKDWENDA